MKKYSSFIKVLIGSLLIASISTPLPKVLAEEPLCVAIYTCDEFGNTIAPYDTADDVCAEQFRRQCASIKANLMVEKLISCEADLERSEAIYKKKFRMLQRKLRAQRN